MIELNKLKQHENINQARYKELRIDIPLNGYLEPSVVDEKSLIILDGHHRFEVLKTMAFTTIPVHLVDYQSKSVEVSSWRKNKNITKADVLTMGLSKNLFPSKTSKHLFGHIKKVKVQIAKIT